jgi:hypothetical protein
VKTHIAFQMAGKKNATRTGGNGACGEKASLADWVMAGENPE